MPRLLRQFLQFLFSPSQETGSQWFVIGAVSLLSISLWLSVTLNREYSTSRTYVVFFDDFPSDISVTEIFDPNVSINLKGNGLDLMGKSLRFRRDTLHLTFNQQAANFDQKFIHIPSYSQDLSQLMGPEIEIVNLTPERLYFSFEKKASKKVPLVLRKDLKLATSFHLVDQPVLIPDSVTISGLASDLDTIDYWFTEGGETSLLTQRKSMLVDVIDTVAGISVEPVIAELQVTAQQYKQVELEVAVSVPIIPDSVERVRLSHPFVRYSCLVPSREYETLTNQMRNLQIEIDYQDLDPRWPYIIPEPQLPDAVQLIQRQPLELNYVIVSK